MPQQPESVCNHHSSKPEADKVVFQPASSASFRWCVGGPRMVRAAKEALSAVLGRQRWTDELLVTSLTHVKNVLNSRKLTPPGLHLHNPTDPEALTSNGV
jgi:hypothetical protein